MFEENQEVEAAEAQVPVEVPQRGNRTKSSTTEGAEAPEETPQRRTSTRTKTRTKLYGIDFVDAEEEEESAASKRFGNSEDVRRKLAELRINVIEDRKTREQEWKLENQRRKEVEVQERKALISNCIMRTKEIEADSKKVWEQIKEEVKQMGRSELEKDLKLPMEMSEMEKIELEEVMCKRNNFY